MRRSFFKSLQHLSEKRKYFFDRIDQRITSFMSHAGHVCERWLLGILFAWFGILKIIGHFSASSIIAKSIYLFEPAVMVPLLGVWEFLIGLFLVMTGTQRLAVLLIGIRIPGTLFALVFKYQECFDGSLFFPTIQGQYLLKELTLLSAALIIGGTVRSESSH